MEFGCSVCEYTSYKKENVLRHVNKKKSCGSGTREIVEIPVEIKCDYCSKNFSTKANLKLHIKNTCSQRVKILEEENRKLKEELKKSRENEKSKMNVTNNNITNNNTNYIIVINNYEDTNLEKITDKTYNKILMDTEAPHHIIPELIRKIHFDPNTPENFNIYIANMTKNNKHLKMYKNGHWEITDKTTEIDNIIADKENNLSDWVNEKGSKYPEAKEKYDEYLEQKYEPGTAKLIREEVGLLLYNNRHLITDKRV